MTTVDPQALRSDALANHARIVDAARVVFAERGLEATLSEVAEAAGVGVGTIYRRFVNKEGLIAALFASRLQALATIAVAAEQMDDAWEGLRYLLRESCRMLAADHGLRDLMLPAASRTDTPPPLTTLTDEVLTARTRLIELSTALVARAKSTGMLRDDCEATDLPILIIAVQAGADLARPHTDEMWDRVVGIVIDGLRAHRSCHSDLAVPALTIAQMDAAMGTGRDAAR